MIFKDYLVRVNNSITIIRVKRKEYVDKMKQFVINYRVYQKFGAFHEYVYGSFERFCHF